MPATMPPSLRGYWTAHGWRRRAWPCGRWTCVDAHARRRFPAPPIARGKAPTRRVGGAHHTGETGACPAKCRVAFAMKRSTVACTASGEVPAVCGVSTTPSNSNSSVGGAGSLS